MWPTIYNIINYSVPQYHGTMQYQWGAIKSQARRVYTNISKKSWLSVTRQYSALIKITLLHKFYPAAMAKGYKLVITHFLGFLAKYIYSDSASPRPRIVFCLQPPVVGYNYFVHVVMDDQSRCRPNCSWVMNYMPVIQVGCTLNTSDK